MTEIMSTSEVSETSSLPLVEYSPPANGQADARMIHARGGVALLVGQSVLAEVSGEELEAGLAAAGEMSAADLARASRQLADELRIALERSHTADSLADLAADAAALFVLCLRRNGVATRDGVGPCAINFDPATREVELAVSA